MPPAAPRAIPVAALADGSCSRDLRVSFTAPPTANAPAPLPTATPPPTAVSLAPKTATAPVAGYAPTTAVSSAPPLGVPVPTAPAQQLNAAPPAPKQEPCSVNAAAVSSPTQTAPKQNPQPQHLVPVSSAQSVSVRADSVLRSVRMFRVLIIRPTSLALGTGVVSCGAREVTDSSGKFLSWYCCSLNYNHCTELDCAGLHACHDDYDNDIFLQYWLCGSRGLVQVVVVLWMKPSLVIMTVLVIGSALMSFLVDIMEVIILIHFTVVLVATFLLYLAQEEVTSSNVVAQRKPSAAEIIFKHFTTTIQDCGMNDQVVTVVAGAQTTHAPMVVSSI